MSLLRSIGQRHFPGDQQKQLEELRDRCEWEELTEAEHQELIHYEDSFNSWQSQPGSEPSPKGSKTCSRAIKMSSLSVMMRSSSSIAGSIPDGTLRLYQLSFSP